MNYNDQKRLVLRFRDIELDLGETIAEHEKCIRSGGSTWWGWLYRSFEQFPIETLREWATQAAASIDGIELFLYDTGQGKVYSARCREIAYYPYMDTSPDAQLTPRYYNKKKAPAWFRLTDLEECDASRIIGSIVTEMPSASEDCAIDLLGSPVTNLKDMRRQEVTMWIVSLPTD